MCENEIQVDQNSWRTARGPDWLTTSGLGPCIAVIILNHAKKRAWLSHDSGISATEASGLRKMIADANKKRKNTDDIEVHIRGDKHFPGIDVRADRKCVSDLVKASFPEAKVEWGEVYFLEVIFEEGRWTLHCRR